MKNFNSNNNTSLFQQPIIVSNDTKNNINYDMNNFYLEEFKKFFKKYIAEQRKKI